IGFRNPDDYFRVTQGEQRYGTEIHANVASNILQDVYIRWLWWPYYLLVVAVMVGIGAVVRARFSPILSLTIAVPFTDPPKKFDVPGLLFVADLIYLLLGFVLYKSELIYIVRTYHLIAPFIAYWLTGKLRKKRPVKSLARATS